LRARRLDRDSDDNAPSGNPVTTLKTALTCSPATTLTALPAPAAVRDRLLELAADMRFRGNGW
jgi:hypothetical protein